MFPTLPITSLRLVLVLPATVLATGLAAARPPAEFPQHTRFATEPIGPGDGPADTTNPGGAPALHAEGKELRVLAQNTPVASAGERPALASDRVEPREGPIKVVSTAFKNGAPIPDAYAAEGRNLSPPLNWDDGPTGTRSFALVLEDPDAPQDEPFVHWIVFNLPADTTQLPEAGPDAPPQGGLPGTNSRGDTGYFGPRPPTGDPAHTYHFQVFALDAMLDLPPGASRDELVEAIQGHVISTGEIVGTYARTGSGG